MSDVVVFSLEDSGSVADWLRKRICPEAPGVVSKKEANGTYFGVVREDDVLLACYGFRNARYDKEGLIFDLEFVIATAGEKVRPWNRRSLHKMFDYPFKAVGCRRITSYVDADNSLSEGLSQRLGFIKEGRMVDGTVTPDIDLIILGMTRNRWMHHQQKMWIKNK